ncbi:MAG: ABC transporter permease [Bacteroidia bacterium]|nr:ABC transporter permease [Bacteroidia bacterium]
MDKPNNYSLSVDASGSGLNLNLKELFKYKDLFFVLAYRDLRVRYSQTFIGLLWAFIQPAATLLILCLVFGRFVNVNTNGIPYPVFAITGVALWNYFSFVLSQSGSSLINAQEMVKKIYFPRLIIPLSKAVVGLVDFAVAMLILVMLFIYYGITPGKEVVFLPVFIVLTIFSSLSIGVWLSALSIRYRDFQYVLPFLIQFGLYLSPIAYPTQVVINNLPSWAVFLFYLNPMTGIIEGFRWCLFGGHLPSHYFWISISFVSVLFFSGLFYFKKVERTMADII